MAESKSDDERGGEPELPFDERLARLEELVKELEEGGLEEGGLGLEAAIGRYEEGVALLRAGHAQLARYRARVDELSTGAEAVLREFEGDPDAAGDGGEGS